MYEIAFRCDASKFHKIGTGHLYRSLAIAEGLTKKYNLKKNKLIFICKRNKLDRKIKKIIKNKKFNVIFFKEKNEINFLKKLKVKNIIFDRILKENRKHIEIIKKKFDKVIYLESLNNNINECLRINSIIHKKNIRYSGFKFLITPLLNEKRNKLIENKKKIFINLGGINKILAYYIYERLSKISKFKDFKFCLNKDLGILRENVEPYDNKNFYQKLKQSKIVICSGGLIFFDSLFLRKKILIFAKDKFQRDNVYKVNRLLKTKIQIINMKNLKFNFLKLYKNTQKIKKNLNLKDMDQTLKIIYNYIYD